MANALRVGLIQALELIMRMLALQLFTIGLCGCVQGSKIPDNLSLKTGGGIFEPSFSVKLSSSGQLDVAQSAVPSSPAKSLTLKLSAAQSSEIFLLASQSKDFALGCGQVADGTSAGMKIAYKGVVQTFSCHGAPKWPRGADTGKLLSAINKHLPDDLRVY